MWLALVFSFLINVALLGVIFYLVKMHQIDRKDMMNCIISRGDPIEYGILAGSEKKPTVKNPAVMRDRVFKTALEELQEKARE